MVYGGWFMVDGFKSIHSNLSINHMPYTIYGQQSTANRQRFKLLRFKQPDKSDHKENDKAQY